MSKQMKHECPIVAVSVLTTHFEHDAVNDCPCRRMYSLEQLVDFTRWSGEKHGRNYITVADIASKSDGIAAWAEGRVNESFPL